MMRNKTAVLTSLILWMGMVSIACDRGVEKSVNRVAGGGKTATPERLDTASRKNRPVVLDYHAKWCGTCDVMNRELFASKTFAQYIEKNNAIFLRVDMNGEKRPDLARRFDIHSLPAMVLLLPGKKRQWYSARITGYRGPEKTMSMLEGRLDRLKLDRKREEFQ